MYLTNVPTSGAFHSAICQYIKKYIIMLTHYLQQASLKPFPQQKLNLQGKTRGFFAPRHSFRAFHPQAFRALASILSSSPKGREPALTASRGLVAPTRRRRRQRQSLRAERETSPLGGLHMLGQTNVFPLSAVPGLQMLQKTRPISTHLKGSSLYFEF